MDRRARRTPSIRARPQWTLDAFDHFAEGINELVDMPDKTVHLLHDFLRQGGGMLSKRVREKEFAALKDDEVRYVERLYSETIGALTFDRSESATDPH